LYNKGKTVLFTYPSGRKGAFTIPDGVIIIGDRAFYRCENLTGANLPAGVISIGEEAFSGCTSLVSITIPNSVTSIGDKAFDYSGLTDITIPNSVTSIGDSAFISARLTSVTFAEGSNIINFGIDAFPQGSEGYGGQNLRSTYSAAMPKAGTYTRAANGSTWTKSS
jgi:hypothetical protein